jgi:hypothetical protein
MHASVLFHSLALVTFLSLPQVSITKFLKVVSERDEKAHNFPFDILEIRRLVQHLHATHHQFFRPLCLHTWFIDSTPYSILRRRTAKPAESSSKSIQQNEPRYRLEQRTPSSSRLLGVAGLWVSSRVHSLPKNMVSMRRGGGPICELDSDHKEMGACAVGGRGGNEMVEKRTFEEEAEFGGFTADGGGELEEGEVKMGA